jgi:hypothetical protein
MKAITDELAACLGASVIYEDFTTGLRGKEWVDRVCRQIGEEAELKVDLWRFDLLHVPAFRERAALDASEADLIVLSMHGGDLLPPQVQDWMYQWLTLKTDQSAAFVVLLDGTGARSNGNSPLLAGLRGVAQGAGLALFCHFCEARRVEAELSIGRILERAEQSSTVLEEILQQSHASVRWGINE